MLLSTGSVTRVEQAKPSGPTAMSPYLQTFLSGRPVRPQTTWYEPSGTAVVHGTWLDAFGTTVGVLAMLDVAMCLAPDGCPDDPVVRAVEGWILGQA